MSLITGHELGIWICGCRLFCEGCSKGGIEGGVSEIGTWHFFTHAKVRKVLTLDIHFFGKEFLGIL